eukprot:1195122-Prorocentrum_minimum.AAC.7
MAKSAGSNQRTDVIELPQLSCCLDSSQAIISRQLAGRGLPTGGQLPCWASKSATSASGTVLSLPVKLLDSSSHPASCTVLLCPQKECATTGYPNRISALESNHAHCSF